MEDFIKLGRLKLIDAQNPTAAENVFMEVSRLTGACIQWENGCKVAPFRKEPSIKLSGPEESVKLAKRMLLDKMEVQNNRVVMKVDITHFEHPSLIGKSGRLIKKVMENSGCHIHFPDGNKYPDCEKSNQVSISGEPLNVEKARLMLRALIPVQILFEVPSTSNFQQILDPCSPESREIERLFGLLMYSFKGNNGIVVVLRCNQDKFSQLRKEIPLLIEQLCGQKGYNRPQVYIITDIMPQHQYVVRGNNNYNLEDIKRKTGANIVFPDAYSARTQRNSILISGNFDCVFMAWQELMNILPITVTFDVNYTREIVGEYKNFLEDCGVSIYSHEKPKYHVKSVSLKGPEKFSKQMLQYHQHLLRLPCLSFPPDNDQKSLALKLATPTNEYFRSTYSSIPPSIANNLSGQGKITKGTRLQGSSYFLESESVSNISSTGQDNNWTSSVSHNQDVTDTSSIDYHELKILAAKAMRRPIESHESTQVPSNVWAGYGFSQSMPASVIKDNLDALNHYSCTSFDNSSSGSSADSETWENIVLRDCMANSIWSTKREGTFSHSNYFDFMRGPTLFPKTDLAEGTLPDILWQNNLQNYSDIFIKEEVDYQTFLLLNDEDLQNLGIPFHARIKMNCLIRDLQEKAMRQQEPKTFNAAPGAERRRKSSAICENLK